MKSVREMVAEIRAEVRDTDLDPLRASEMLAKLTALYGNTMDEVRVAEMAYNGILLERLSGEEAANRAKIRAQTSPEYERFRTAKDTERLCLELIRSLKHLLRMKAEEMRLS
jgi:uncharacterized protein YjaG (DUF416 family)